MNPDRFEVDAGGALNTNYVQRLTDSFLLGIIW